MPVLLVLLGMYLGWELSAFPLEHAPELHSAPPSEVASNECVGRVATYRTGFQFFDPGCSFTYKVRLPVTSTFYYLLRAGKPGTFNDGVPDAPLANEVALTIWDLAVDEAVPDPTHGVMTQQEVKDSLDAVLRDAHLIGPILVHDEYLCDASGAIVRYLSFVPEKKTVVRVSAVVGHGCRSHVSGMRRYSERDLAWTLDASALTRLERIATSFREDVTVLQCIQELDESP